MRAAQRLVGALWRWHRRIGLAAALFVLLLSVTGIALNHSPGLALDQTYVQWQWLLRSYGDDSAARIGYRLDAGWLSRSTGGQLYFNSTEVTTCYDELVGALQTPDFVLAACADQLVLLLPDGQLIEALTTSGGLPTPVAGIGRVEYGGQPAIALQVESQWRLADVDALQFHEPVPAGALVEQAAPGPLPAGIANALPGAQQWLTWERVLLDLHSGRLFGPVGVWVMDAAAVLLMCLASSGVAMWALHRRRRVRR